MAAAQDTVSAELKQQVEAALDCPMRETPRVDDGLAAFLSQRFSVTVSHWGVTCYPITQTSPPWQPLAQFSRLGLAIESDCLVLPYLRPGSKSELEKYQEHMAQSAKARALSLTRIARDNGDGSSMLNIELEPGRPPWPLVDVIAILCSRARDIPDLPVPYDPYNPEFDNPDGSGGIHFRDLSGWQVLVWIVLPMARFLYGILPPPQRFGESRDIRIARNQAQFQREMGDQVAMIPRFLQLRQQLPDSIDVRPGIMIGLSDVPAAQRFVPPPPATFGPSPFAPDPEPPSRTEQKEIPDRFFDVQFRNPVPNRMRLNPGMGVGIAENPQVFRQEQQDFPATAKRPAYKGSARQFPPTQDPMDES